MSAESYENPIVDILSAKETEPDWLVKEMFLQGALVLLAGEPGAGKSFISYTIALAIAAGVKAFGGLIPAGEPRRVLYFDEENSTQDRDKYLRRSFNGLTAANGEEPDLALLHQNFFPVHFALGDDQWVETAQGYVEKVLPHAMMFDTATPSFNIEDENNNAEATRAVKGVRSLMRMTDPVALALILKHAKTRTDGGRRSIRGAKAWQGMADGVMFQVKSNGRPRKTGLNLTRLEPDKTRAYGLTRTIYISPSWTDDKKSGLLLDASYTASKEHQSEEDDDHKDD